MAFVSNANMPSNDCSRFERSGKKPTLRGLFQLLPLSRKGCAEYAVPGWPASPHRCFEGKLVLDLGAQKSSEVTCRPHHLNAALSCRFDGDAYTVNPPLLEQGLGG